MNQKNERRLNKTGTSILTVILLVLLSFSGSTAGGILVFILIAAGVAALAIYFAKKLSKPKEDAARAYTTHETSRPRKYDPAEIQDRDSRRRLEQLDSFLKNGIIDKKEYVVLRAKYLRELDEG